MCFADCALFGNIQAYALFGNIGARAFFFVWQQQASGFIAQPTIDSNSSDFNPHPSESCEGCRCAGRKGGWRVQDVVRRGRGWVGALKVRAVQLAKGTFICCWGPNASIVFCNAQDLQSMHEQGRGLWLGCERPVVNALDCGQCGWHFLRLPGILFKNVSMT